MHTFVTCNAVERDFAIFEELVKEINNKEVKTKEILTISFTNRNKRRRMILVWFVAKILIRMFNKMKMNEALEQIVLELKWFLQWQVKIGSIQEMNRLKGMVENKVLSI